MAEPAEIVPGPGVDRRLWLIASVGVVFAFIFFFMMYRSCQIAPGRGYTVVYSNLDLKEAASIVTQLKAMKISYQLREEGRSIAVPKDKADEVKLELAAKGLPVGGVVGWEIFDQAKLGATDFDRRINLIRAISGELSRTIRRIEEVEDARVQIVIPETKLFEVTKAPVTASVLLKLRPGAKLSKEQVDGIVKLVASSVENLLPENVTVVDIYGNILSGKAEIPPKVVKPLVEKKVEVPILPVAPVPTPEIVKPTIITPEEEIITQLKAKEELERQLSGRAQSVLNQFYPPNTALVKVNVELGPPKKTYPVQKAKPKTKTKAKPKSTSAPKVTEVSVSFGSREVKLGEIKRITVIILIDNRFPLTKALKKSTFVAVAGAVGYDRGRGDKIDLRKVPFHYAAIYKLPEELKKEIPEEKSIWQEAFSYTLNLANQVVNKIGLFNTLAILFGIILLIVILRSIRRRREILEEEVEIPRVERPREVPELGRSIEQMRTVAETEPEKLAGLLRRWLQEG